MANPTDNAGTRRRMYLAKRSELVDTSLSRRNSLGATLPWETIKGPMTFLLMARRLTKQQRHWICVQTTQGRFGMWQLR
jgi:hypothetical protein